MGQRTNRLAVALPVAGALSLVLSAVTMAATVIGTNGDDHLTGTAGKDRIIASSGDDTVDAVAGGDRVRGGPGRAAPKQKDDGVENKTQSPANDNRQS